MNDFDTNRCNERLYLFCNNSFIDKIININLMSNLSSDLPPSECATIISGRSCFCSANFSQVSRQSYKFGIGIYTFTTFSI